MNFFENAVGKHINTVATGPWTRVSSSQLKLYESCPRRWFYTYVCGNPIETNEAMALGTLVHAFLEFYSEHGEKATLEDILEMEGNYDPPSKAYNEYPHLLDEAILMSNRVIDDYPNLFEGEWLNEFDVEELELKIDGVTLGGYIDRLRKELKKVVSDWKTRNSMTYAPRTDADFRSDDQLLYYAAIMWYVYGGSWVVEHINILRGKGDVHRRASVIPDFYLRGVWDHFHKTIKTMKVESTLEHTEVPVGYEDACYKYGKPCPFMDVCERKPADFFDFGAKNMRIKSPQAPAPEYAVPYEQKSIKILPLNSKSLAAAKDMGLKTLADVDEWLAGGGDWTSIAGVGKVTAEKIAAIHESLRATRA